MSTMVVQAHPVDDSFNVAVLERVLAGLDQNGDDYHVCRIGEGQRPTADQLANVERLVLVYPTWGGGQPAMLLDWLHEMLASGAFESVGYLQAATTHGSSRLVNKMQGEWGRRFLGDRIASACRPGTKLGWQALYKIDRCSADERAEFLAGTKRYFSGPPLPAR